MEEKKPVGIWIRVSHEDAVRGESPEHHERRARAYAELKGWSVKKLYRLDAVSGRSVKDLPEAKEMLRDVREGHIQGLIFSKLARLARNTRELLDFADYFQEHGADLISLQESIDTSSPAGRLFYTMIAALAQWEREEISSRVAASVPVRAEMGKPVGGSAQFGYRWVDGRLEPDPKEAPVRKLMYKLFLTHKRRRSVARALNEAGHRTRKGNLFTGTAVDRLLRDPITKGQRRANYTTSESDGSVALKPETEWVVVDVEPIISVDLWEEVNALMAEQRAVTAERRRRPGRKPRQLFAGLTYCGCGKKMYARSNSPKYVCENCRNKIPIEDLDRVFISQFRSFLLSPSDVSAFISRAETAVQEKEALLLTLREELKSVERQMEKVYRLYLADEISPSGFGARYGPLEERQRQIRDEIPRVEGETDSLRIQYLSNQDIFSDTRTLIERWEEFSFEERRSIVENMVDKVTIEDDQVVLDLVFAPSAANHFLESDKTVLNPWWFVPVSGEFFILAAGR